MILVGIHDISKIYSMSCLTLFLLRMLSHNVIFMILYFVPCQNVVYFKLNVHRCTLQTAVNSRGEKQYL